MQEAVKPTKAASFELLEELNATRVEYNFAYSSDEYREVVKELVKYVNRMKKTRHIFDARELGVLSPDIQNWASKTFAQAAMKNVPEGGSFYAAIVVGEDVFGRLAVKNIGNKAAALMPGFMVKYFQDMEAAEAWICQV